MATESYSKENIMHSSIKEDLKILYHFDDLSEFFMVDYYTESGYELLPKPWLEIATNDHKVFLKQLCGSLLPEKTFDISVVMPLSLLCFIALIRKKLSLRRRQLSAGNNLPISCKTQLKFLKPKKILELSAMLPCVQKVISDERISHIVDIGSGVGHASRFIAKQNPSCSILRIEAQSTLINKAENIDERFDKASKPANIFSAVCRLNLDSNVVSSFIEILQEADKANGTSFAQPNSRVLLLGLHPCGNLGSFMLRLFKGCGACQAIVIVSCCYMFIDKEDDQKGGFPLSNVVEEQGIMSLSGQLKEQACHKAEFYLSRLLEQLKDPDSLAQNWRSIADIFLSKRDSKCSRTWFKFKKRSPGEGIVNFINKNLKLHKLTFLEKEEEELALELSVVDQWRTWAYYLVYIVKLSLGVVGECVILKDRLSFLLECGYSSKFEILFDPKESSRNVAIISSK